MNTDEIKIEKGVPMRSCIRDYSNMTKFTDIMRKMEIGDSFIAEEKKRTNFTVYSALAGIKISTRKQADGTVRCWRIA